MNKKTIITLYANEIEDLQQNGYKIEEKDQQLGLRYCRLTNSKGNTIEVRLTLTSGFYTMSIHKNGKLKKTINAED